MAEQKKRRTDQQEYRARSTYGDLAYDLDYAEREYRLRHAGEEQQEREPYMRPAAKPREDARRQTAARPRRAVRLSPALTLCSVAILGTLFMIILGCVALSQLSSQIVELKEQVSELSQENVDLTTKHELTFDLSSIKQQAEAAGMSKPSDSQTYYLDLSGDDNAVVHETAAEPGPLRALAASLKQSVCAVVEYFR
ncbi:MAG: hypothetical protein ACI3WR_07790 [Oscillospiraceae bacterium]